jgi:hypothetical protein
MDHTLAKELKDAGFPQGGNGRWIIDPNLIVVRRGDRAYIPTLEELIEACGDDFSAMNKYRDHWVAAFGFAETYENATGAMPTEAVARLWLALNKK